MEMETSRSKKVRKMKAGTQKQGGGELIQRGKQEV